jgi:hypothetical protein
MWGEWGPIWYKFLGPNAYQLKRGPIKANPMQGYNSSLMNSLSTIMEKEKMIKGEKPCLVANCLSLGTIFVVGWLISEL